LAEARAREQEAREKEATHDWLLAELQRQRFVSRCEYRSVRGSRNIGMPNFFKTAATSGCQKISKVPSERQSIAIRTPSTGCWGWASQRATAMRSGSVRKLSMAPRALRQVLGWIRGSVLERARTKL
jgi:hypothetical protein